MKINIHTPSGLIPISPEVTKQTIIEALGYTPANQAAYDSIDATDDTTFYIIDSQQHVLAKVDADGLHAAIMTVNGKDVESGLIYDIKELDDSAFYIVDKDQNIICRIDENGLTTTAIAATYIHAQIIHTDNLETESSELYIADKDNKPIFKVGANGVETTNVVASDAILSQHSVVGHIEDNTRHVTEAEKAIWHSKSKIDSISEDIDSVLLVQDKNDKPIVRIDESGITTTTVISNDTLVAGNSTLGHIENSNIHIQDEERNIWNSVINKASKQDLEQHINDSEKHLQENERVYWNQKVDTISDDSDFIIVDSKNNKILEVNSEGVNAGNLKIRDQQVATIVDVNTQVQDLKDTKLDTEVFNATKISLENAISDLDQTKTELSNFNSHVTNTDIHLGDEITVEDDTTLYVKDSEGEVIAQFGETGVIVGQLTASNIVLQNETLSDTLTDLSNDITTAKNEAIAIAATDAKNKADAAEADAKSHANSLNSAMDIRVKANTEAIETLNGTQEGSVSFKINAAFNDFATKVSNDEVVNTYKELIDYAADHGAEFTALVGTVSKKAEKEVLNNHMSDDTRHIGDEIKLEDNSTLYIVDNEEKIIAQFDGSGLTVKDLTATNINIEEESLSNKLNNLSIAIATEATTRETSDNNLQKQIDSVKKWQNEFEHVDFTAEIAQAKQEAITTAAEEATKKANTAELNAKSHANQLNEEIDERIDKLEAQDVYVKTLVDADIADAKKAGTDAYNHAESLNIAMNTRVTTLEEHKNDYIAADTTLSTLLKEYTDESVKDKVSNETFTNHINDLNVHIGEDIRLDDDAVLYIVDKDDKIIAQFDSNGFNAGSIYHNEKPVVSSVIIDPEATQPSITEEGVLVLPSDKNDIPGNGKITVKFGSSKQSFYVNQTNPTEITIPNNLNSFVNDSGFTTNKGTVKSVSLSVPTGFKTTVGTVNGEGGTLTFDFDEKYELHTSDQAAQWTGKQDSISDLETIRTNADLGQQAHAWGNHTAAGYLLKTGGVLTGDVDLIHSSILFDGGQTASISCIQDGLQITSSDCSFKFAGMADFNTSVFATKFVKKDGTANQVLLANGDTKAISTFPDIYPTAFKWNNGALAGPIGVLSTNDSSIKVTFDAIPSASNTRSGVVTIGPQSFSGNKTLSNESTFTIAKTGPGGDNWSQNLDQPYTNRAFVIGQDVDKSQKLLFTRFGLQAWDAVSDELDRVIPSLYIQGAGGSTIFGGPIRSKQSELQLVGNDAVTINTNDGLVTIEDSAIKITKTGSNSSTIVSNKTIDELNVVQKSYSFDDVQWGHEIKDEQSIADQVTIMNKTISNVAPGTYTIEFKDVDISNQVYTSGDSYGEAAVNALILYINGEQYNLIDEPVIDTTTNPTHHYRGSSKKTFKVTTSSVNIKVRLSYSQLLSNIPRDNDLGFYSTVSVSLDNISMIGNDNITVVAKDGIYFQNGSETSFKLGIGNSSTLILNNLPTSPTDLQIGSLYNSNGTIKIVQ